METTTLPIEQSSKRRAEALGFRLVRVQQQSADVYQIFDATGYFGTNYQVGRVGARTKEMPCSPWRWMNTTAHLGGKKVEA